MSGGVSLCVEERETISRELSRDNSARGIATLLGRYPRTIAREIDRDGGAAYYRGLGAQERDESVTVGPKECRFAASSWLPDAVNDGWEQTWSLEQIRVRLAEEYPDEPERRVSLETLDLALSLPVTGELRAEADARGAGRVG